jgi:hypothetical protein
MMPIAVASSVSGRTVAISAVMMSWACILALPACVAAMLRQPAVGGL